MSYDYLMEAKLNRESPALKQIFSDNVVGCQNILTTYKSIFPGYTDHTMLHSLEVISFCNELVGDQIDLLNTDEIFILLMAAYLHDSGMGIPESMYGEFLHMLPMAEAYAQAHPDADTATVIRTFHHEFSGCFIRRFAQFFDIPSEEHLFAIVQTSRGHRKTDLWDEAEYPAEFRLKNGAVVRLPYLAALIRLADELDIAADRNLQFLYSMDSLTTEHDRNEFRRHASVRQLIIAEDRFIARVHRAEGLPQRDLDEMFEKLTQTLDYCVAVVEARTPFRIRQRVICVENI